MVIKKVLNNNVVITEGKNGVEEIVMGRGIAFQKRAGDFFNEEKIDKIFSLSNPDASSKFRQLVVEIPMEHISMAEEIIRYAQMTLGKKLNEMIYISLVDHVYTSIIRFQDGITVKNALLWDIRRFYKDEFAVGLEALRMIKKRFNIMLPEDEAGFIALHLVNAEMDDSSVHDMYEITKVMQEIVNIVKYTFNITFDEDSVYYYRFITHLKFFAQRLIRHTTYENDTSDDLLAIIREKYKNSYECVCKIDQFIQNKYHYPLSNEEKLYLTIHVERAVYKTAK